MRVLTHLPHETSCTWLLVSTWTCAGKALASWKQCVWQEDQAPGYFEQGNQGGPFRSELRRMPMGLTGLTTSAASRQSKWMNVIPDAGGGAKGYSCYARHLCSEQLTVSSPLAANLCSLLGNELATGMPGKEGKWMWQASANHCHKIYHASGAACQKNILNWGSCPLLQSLNWPRFSATLYVDAPVHKPVLWDLQCSRISWAFLGILWPCGGTGGMHSQCGTAADEFPFTMPRAYVSTVTYSGSLWQHVSSEELQGSSHVKYIQLSWL